MTFEEAAVVLGVKLDKLTENDLRIAYARAVKLAHPDTGGGEQSLHNVGRVREAKDKLLTYTFYAGDQWHAVACRTCKGTGQVRGTFAMAVCQSCKGTGNEDLSRR